MITALLTMVASAAALQPAELSHSDYKDLIVDPQVKTTHRVNRKYGEVLTGPQAGDREALGLNYVQQTIGHEWQVTDSYASKAANVHHLYLRQMINGLPVSNALANINIDAQGRIINMGHSEFNITAKAPSAKPTITPSDALRAFSNWAGYPMAQDSATVNVGNGQFAMGPTDAATENMTATLCYTRTGGADDRLVLTWDISPVFTPDGRHAMNAFVGQDGTVVQALDWMKWSTYDAFEIPNLDPAFGRSRKEGIESPEKMDVSPKGWNDMDRPGDGKGAYTTTKGNNVYAQDNPTGGSSWENNYRPDGGDDLEFAGAGFEINYNQEPGEYKAAAIGNLFYWNNVIHDLFYPFGFDEAGGNFQETNFVEGPSGQNDAVQANGQDGGGYNNANFYTPANGQRPRMRMYLWNQDRPMKDGDLDSGIIVHEFAHGISNRLTGGPSNVGCLGSGQSGGMGEGWGDWFATAFQQTSVETMEGEWPMGEYAAGRGIRPYPYSTRFEYNPQTFTFITQSGYSGVHAKGSVWCEILHQVMYEMIQVDPINLDWYSGEGGNGKLLHAVTMGMALQPCRPNFVEARDAIFQAMEQIGASRELSCAAWKGFAERGMGVDAFTDGSNTVREDYNVPADC
jgi:extracellular elastinolytic metalloproteinase